MASTTPLPSDMAYQERMLEEQPHKDLSLTENIKESAKELKDDLKEATHNLKEGLLESAHSLKKNVKVVADHANEISRDIVLG